MDIDTLHTGDCLSILEMLDAQSVDLIYLDPPFFSQATHKLKTRDNIKEYTFSDTWDSLTDYKHFIKERMKKCRRVLKDTGSIFVHCDSSASHHLRLLLDVDKEPDAVEMARARLEQPQKTLSKLLEVGKTAYLNQDEKTKALLDSISALVIQRNNGLDGFLKCHYMGYGLVNIRK